MGNTLTFSRPNDTRNDSYGPPTHNARRTMSAVNTSSIKSKTNKSVVAGSVTPSENIARKSTAPSALSRGQTVEYTLRCLQQKPRQERHQKRSPLKADRHEVGRRLPPKLAQTVQDRIKAPLANRLPGRVEKRLQNWSGELCKPHHGLHQPKPERAPIVQI